MKRRERTRGSVAFSIAVHVAIIVALGTMTFHYPIGDLFGPPEHRSAPEELHFVDVGAQEPIGNGSEPNAPPPKSAPAPLRAPTSIPTSIPILSPSAPSVGAISGVEGGKGGAPTGRATGIQPIMPDARISLSPGRFNPVPKSRAEQIDSVVASVFGTYMDSVAVADANRGKAPTDWTWGKEGQTWGMDPQYIHLGKFKLPTTLLALIPFKTQGTDGSTLINARTKAWIRQDVIEHAQQAISEDEFRAAVKRIRARKSGDEKLGEVKGSILGSDGRLTVTQPEHGGRTGRP